MMMIFRVLALLLLTSGTMAQTRKSFDSLTKQPIWDGPIQISELTSAPEFDWLKQGMETYRPDPEVLAELRRLNIQAYHLTLVLGTWCSDSHVLVPRLLRVLSALDFPEQQLQIFGTNLKKEIYNGMHETLELTYIPLILVYHPREGLKGSITEQVRVTIEKDLLSILAQEAETGAAK